MRDSNLKSITLSAFSMYAQHSHRMKEELPFVHTYIHRALILLPAIIYLYRYLIVS